MISAHATHTGRVRKNNEDCIRTDDALGIYLLADGIGGLHAGEVASALAIATVHEVLRLNLPHTDAEGYFELMVHAMHAAHWEIQTQEQAHVSAMRMGTTLVIVVVQENRAYIVHAGDSRCYLLHNDTEPTTLPTTEHEGNLIRLTHDHTVGDREVASGKDIGAIPKKHFHTLTQAIGSGDPPSPDFTIVDLSPGDLLLICSDGLTDMLTDPEIEAILVRKDASLDLRVTELIDAANRRGGRDNISVILAKSD
jgi:protein phosphatase